MSFNRIALVIFVCIALSAVSLSTAQTVQEWGDENSQNIKIYDEIEWHPPRQGGIRVAKFNFPTLVSSDEKYNNFTRMVSVCGL